MRADRLDAMTDTIALADGFRPVDRAQWHQLVAAALARTRGQVAPEEAERLIATPTDDGYSLHALYTRADVVDLPMPADPGQPDFVRGSQPATGRGWSLRQRHWLTSPDVADEVADDLANGVDSIWLTSGDNQAADAVLGELDLAKVPVVMQAFRSTTDQAQALLDAVSDGPVHPHSSLGLDPIGHLAATGRLGDLDEAGDLARAAADLKMLAFTIDGSVYHEAGASDGQELGAVTAAGLETLRHLVDAGMSVDEAAALLEFRWVVSDDQFGSIAKLRAARVLWHRVLDVAGAERPVGQRQHAVTSTAMLTGRDPWVNLIRNCVAAFAGGVGGAEAVTVQPHSLFSSEADELARRLARNTQHVLLSEAHAGFVADPGGGSYYLESRTWRLAEAAWSWLQEIEALGGMRHAVENGLVGQRLDRTWHLRRERVAKRKIPITGVSEFPDAERRDAAYEPMHRPGGGLPQHRFAEDFEALRDRADAAATTPTVVLVALGPLARHSTRQTFAANLFAAGGIATVPVPFEPGQPLELPTGATVACLCGADADYPDLAGPAAEAAREAGAGHVLLAGKPGSRADADAAAGIQDYVYAGCDALAVLTRTLDQLEVTA